MSTLHSEICLQSVFPLSQEQDFQTISEELCLNPNKQVEKFTMMTNIIHQPSKNKTGLLSIRRQIRLKVPTYSSIISDWVGSCLCLMTYRDQNGHNPKCVSTIANLKRNHVYCCKLTDLIKERNTQKTSIGLVFAFLCENLLDGRHIVLIEVQKVFHGLYYNKGKKNNMSQKRTIENLNACEKVAKERKHY